MKKSLVAAMFAVMMISLVGCGKASEPKTIETTEVVEESETAEATETETATEVEAQDEVADDDVAEKPVVDEEPVAEEPASPYSYTELSQTLYAQSTVNVRDLPEQTGAKLGSLTTNQEVTVTGQCNETGWYRISYNGGEGFVSNSYLGSGKVAVKSKSTAKSSSQAESQPAQEAAAEAPAQEAPADPYAGKTWQEKVEYNSTMGLPTMTGLTEEEQAAYIDSRQLDSDSYGCPYCGYTTTSYDEYKAHMDAEGLY